MKECPYCGGSYEPTGRSGLCQTCAKYFGERIQKAKALSMFHHHEQAQEIYYPLLDKAPTFGLILGIAEALSMDKCCFCGLSPKQLSLMEE
jgi:hypothetical protein